MTINNLTHIQKYAIISVLINIMKADNVIHPKEIEFLNDIFIRFNITESEIDSIQSLDLNMDKSIIKAMDDDMKKDVVDLCIQMTNCDGYADPRELTIIENLRN